MDRKKLLIRLASLIFFIFIVNYIATKFYWYSAIWWFDMPMHFLGGFWIALAYFYIFLPHPDPLLIKERVPKAGEVLKGGVYVFKVLLVVLIIGVLWEIFEFSVDKTISKHPFDYLDTFSDIFFDLAGGFTALLYFFRKILLV